MIIFTLVLCIIAAYVGGVLVGYSLGNRAAYRKGVKAGLELPRV